MFYGPSFTILSSITAFNEVAQLTPAFGGRIIVSIGGVVNQFGTYDVAPDLTTVTQNDHVDSADPRYPNGGVLLPCPDL